MRPLLVLDWGIGGLASLYQLLASPLDRPVVYLSDSGYTPYGRVPHPELGARIEQLCAHFRPSALLVACNAASSALSPQLKLPPLTLNVIDAGVEESLKALYALDDRRAVSDPRALRLGVIGGGATIKSGIYERALHERWRLQRALEVKSVVAQPLSAHVEAGRLSGEALERDLRRICEELGAIDALTLACTHYPALSTRFKEALPKVHLIDPAAGFIESACDALKKQVLSEAQRATKGAELTLYTTGDPEALSRAARLAWGRAPPAPCARLKLS